jgi:hypothetical protein
MKLANIVAAVAVLGLVSWALASVEPTTKPKHDGVRGQIVKIDGNNITIKTRARGETEGKEVVVKTDDKTVFTLDEKEAKLADLKADYWVRVTPAEGTATKVNAFTKKPERRKPDAPKAN